MIPLFYDDSIIPFIHWCSIHLTIPFCCFPFIDTIIRCCYSIYSTVFIPFYSIIRYVHCIPIPIHSVHSDHSFIHVTTFYSTFDTIFITVWPFIITDISFVSVSGICYLFWWRCWYLLFLFCSVVRYSPFPTTILMIHHSTDSLTTCCSRWLPPPHYTRSLSLRCDTFVLTFCWWFCILFYGVDVPYWYIRYVLLFTFDHSTHSNLRYDTFTLMHLRCYIYSFITIPTYHYVLFWYDFVLILPRWFHSTIVHLCSRFPTLIPLFLPLTLRCYIDHSHSSDVHSLFPFITHSDVLLFSGRLPFITDYLHSDSILYIRISIHSTTVHDSSVMVFTTLFWHSPTTTLLHSLDTDDRFTLLLLIIVVDHSTVFGIVVDVPYDADLFIRDVFRYSFDTFWYSVVVLIPFLRWYIHNLLMIRYSILFYLRCSVYDTDDMTLFPIYSIRHSTFPFWP